MDFLERHVAYRWWRMCASGVAHEVTREVARVSALVIGG
jgi:hypothetical protein